MYFLLIFLKLKLLLQLLLQVKLSLRFSNQKISNAQSNCYSRIITKPIAIWIRRAKWTKMKSSKRNTKKSKTPSISISSSSIIVNNYWSSYCRRAINSCSWWCRRLTVSPCARSCWWSKRSSSYSSSWFCSPCFIWETRGKQSHYHQGKHRFFCKLKNIILFLFFSKFDIHVIRFYIFLILSHYCVFFVQVIFIHRIKILQKIIFSFKIQVLILFSLI